MLHAHNMTQCCVTAYHSPLVMCRACGCGYNVPAGSKQACGVVHTPLCDRRVKGGGGGGSE